MRPIVASAALLLALAAPVHAQRTPLPHGCGAALGRMMTALPPDSAAVRCRDALVPEVARRLRAARTLSDSAALDNLASAATWFRHPRVFRAELDVASAPRAAEAARMLALLLAFHQLEPGLMVQAREPEPPPPARCGRDAAGMPVCTVSSGRGECSIGVGKHAGFLVDRPISEPLRRELAVLVDRLARRESTSTNLRRTARCIRQARL